MYLQKYPPPLIPPRGEVNAADAFDIGSFDEEDTKGIKVSLGVVIKINFKWQMFIGIGFLLGVMGVDISYHSLLMSCFVFDQIIMFMIYYINS